MNRRWLRFIALLKQHLKLLCTGSRTETAYKLGPNTRSVQTQLSCLFLIWMSLQTSTPTPALPSTLSATKLWTLHCWVWIHSRLSLALIDLDLSEVHWKNLIKCKLNCMLTSKGTFSLSALLHYNCILWNNSQCYIINQINAALVNRRDLNIKMV